MYRDKPSDKTHQGGKGGDMCDHTLADVVLCMALHTHHSCHQPMDRERWRGIREIRGEER